MKRARCQMFFAFLAYIRIFPQIRHRELCRLTAARPQESHMQTLHVVRFNLPQQPIQSRLGALFVLWRFQRHPHIDTSAHDVGNDFHRCSGVGNFQHRHEPMPVAKLSQFVLLALSRVTDMFLGKFLRNTLLSHARQNQGQIACFLMPCLDNGNCLR